MTDILDDGGVASPARAQIGAGVRTRLERNPMVRRIESDRLDIFGRQGFLSREECAGLRAIQRGSGSARDNDGRDAHGGLLGFCD